MEPLGTITKYYKFIDEESQRILNSVMEKSSSYFDFVRNLSTVVLEDEVPDDLAYIATIQVWVTKEEELMSTIAEKYRHLARIKPWILSFKGFQYKSEDYKNFQSIIDDFVVSQKADWIVIELLLQHSLNLLMHLESVHLLSTAKDLLIRNPNLKCFEPLVELADGYMQWLEGEKLVGLSHIQKGLELARKNDDAVYEYYGLLSLGNCKKQLNYREGLDVFEVAYQLAQDLGVSFFVSEILNDSTMAYEIAGEYDLAISSQLDGINVCPDKVGIEISYGILSRLSAALGDGQTALEWANRALDHSSIHSLLLRKARDVLMEF